MMMGLPQLNFKCSSRFLDAKQEKNSNFSVLGAFQVLILTMDTTT